MTTYITQKDSNGVDDSYISEYAPTTTYGTLTTMHVGFYPTGSDYFRGFLRFDLTKGTNIPPVGSPIVSAVVTVNCYQYRVTRTLTLFQCLRMWTNPTWNCYASFLDWTTAGCGSAGNDYVNTDLGNVSVASTGAKDITLNASGIAVLQGWLDTPASNCGWLMKNSAETSDYNTFYTSEHGTEAYRPFLTAEWVSGNQLMVAMFQ